MTIQIKAIEKYFHVALHAVQVALTFHSANETMVYVCDHLNKS